MCQLGTPSLEDGHSGNDDHSGMSAIAPAATRSPFSANDTDGLSPINRQAEASADFPQKPSPRSVEASPERLQTTTSPKLSFVPLKPRSSSPRSPANCWHGVGSPPVLWPSPSKSPVRLHINSPKLSFVPLSLSSSAPRSPANRWHGVDVLAIEDSPPIATLSAGAAEQKGRGSLLLAAVLWVLVICCTHAFAELRWADIDEAGVATVLEFEQHAGGATCAGMKSATERIAQLEALAMAAGLDVPTAEEEVGHASQAPQHRQLFEGPFGVMSSPTAGLSEAYFLLYTSCVMWVGVVSVGLGSEAVFGTLMVRLISNADASQHSEGGMVGGQRLWQMAQLLFSLNILVAFFSRSALGLPFLVLGLWKLGFPETLVSLQLAGQRAIPASMRAFHFIDGLATLLHHTSTAFIIVAATTGLFPHSRALVAPCIVPIVQHMICLLKYVAPRTYLLLMLLTEVYFEWEVFGNLPHMHSPHGAPFSRIGRAVATDMLVSHWLYLVAALIKLVAPCFCSWGPAEVKGGVAQDSNEAAASRADSRLSHGSHSSADSRQSVLSAGAQLMELGMVRHGMGRQGSFKAPALAPNPGRCALRPARLQLRHDIKEAPCPASDDERVK